MHLSEIRLEFTRRIQIFFQRFFQLAGMEAHPGKEHDRQGQVVRVRRVGNSREVGVHFDDTRGPQNAAS